MRFGSCVECNEYKYLPEKGICPTCTESNDWIVYRVVGLSRPKVVEDGLSEESAKEKASADKFLFASREKMVNTD